MRKIKKGLTVFILLLLTTVFCISFAACGNDNSSDSRNGKSAAEIEASAPYGLYTDLQFIFKGENGYVSASVKNKFTLFPSTVTVNIELYRSDVFEESVADMTLVASNYIYDLDQGETLTATASTEGRQSYWKARATYRIDNKAWKENLSETVFFNADGIKATPPESLPDDKEYFISDFLQDYTKTQAFIPVPRPQDDDKYMLWYAGAHRTFYRSDAEFNTIKDLFGEIKLNPYNGSIVDTQLKNGVYVAWDFVPFRIMSTFNDGSKVNLYIDDTFHDFWGANLFVHYYKEENGKTQFSKYFTATVSAEAKQALIDYTTSIYWDTYYQSHK